MFELLHKDLLEQKGTLLHNRFGDLRHRWSSSPGQVSAGFSSRPKEAAMSQNTSYKQNSFSQRLLTSADHRAGGGAAAVEAFAMRHLRTASLTAVVRAFVCIEVVHFTSCKSWKGCNQRKFRRDTSELRKVAKRVRACAWCNCRVLDALAGEFRGGVKVSDARYIIGECNCRALDALAGECRGCVKENNVRFQ